MNRIMLIRNLLVIPLLLSSIFSGAQIVSFSCYITNEVIISPTVYQFDIYLLSTGIAPFEYAGSQWGIIVNPNVADGGTLTCSIVTGSSTLKNLAQINTTARMVTVTSSLNIAARTPPGRGSGSIISTIYRSCYSPGTKMATIQIINTVPFAVNSRMDLAFNFVNEPGRAATKIHAYVKGINTDVTAKGSFYTYNSSGSCLQNFPLNNIQMAVQNQPSLDWKFVVYPNPATNITKVLFVEKNPNDYRLSLMDVTGREVMVQEGKTEEGENSIILDLNKLAKGVYQVNFQKNNYIKTVKLIVE